MDPSPLLDAIPYIQKFRGAIFVIKYGGSFMDSPDTGVRDAVAQDIVSLTAAGINPVIVHGGGKAITRAMQSAGLAARFVQGQRVSDEATVRIADDVLSRQINPQIVAAIGSLGGRARGFAGPDIFRCRKNQPKGLDGQPLDLGYVGEVTAADVGPLLECIKESITPVISPTARGEDGKVYNCNADVAAGRAAMDLKARRLIFLSDVPGLLRDPKDPSTVISHLRVRDVEELKRAGVIDHGMIPKVDSAVSAVRADVEKVSFVDGRVPHAILLDAFTEQGLGTEIVV